jgi:Fur family ferric uptake transcriptional regulator
MAVVPTSGYLRRFATIEERSVSCEPAITTVLKAHGLRRTSQRASILASLRHADGHLTAAEVHARLASPVALSTVYRTLEGLRDAGIVSALEGTRGTTFEWAEAESHHHLRCLRCGSVIEIELPRLASVEAEIRARTGFAANIRHLGIAGLCATCREGSASS